MYDVIIIGAGPTGLMAAYELAKKNRKVLCIEKLSSIDKLKRACSMQLILDEDYEGEGIVVQDSKFIFPKSNFEVPYHGKLIPLYNKYYYSPSGHVMRFATDNGETPFSWKFDKRTLLKELFANCENAGAEFLMNSLAVKISDRNEYAEVTVLTNHRERKTLKAKKIIDAEGVNSNLYNKTSYGKARSKLAIALCCKYIVEGIKGIEKNSWNLFYGRKYHSNAAIIIGPSLYDSNTFEVTITGDKTRMPDTIFAALKENSPLSVSFAESRVIDKIGCSVKAFLPVKEPCKGNIIVAGDAAAFIEVETQGGLLCGFSAAKAIDKELDGKDGYTEYTKWWNNSFEFNSDDYMRVAQGYALVPKYSDDEIDYIFKIAEKKCMPGTYSQYKTPKYMWDNILEHSDTIKTERPEIYEKMQILKSTDLSEAFS